MQTFLPYANFQKTARALDYRRLGKQRVEVYQILRALTGESKGWVNHPATIMWRGYESTLAMYGCIICDEWKKRGYKDTMTEKIVKYVDARTASSTSPYWFGNPDFHRSHQSNLIRKFPEFYGPLFPGVPNDLPYLWPVSA